MRFATRGGPLTRVLFYFSNYCASSSMLNQCIIVGMSVFGESFSEVIGKFHWLHGIRAGKSRLALGLSVGEFHGTVY